MDVYITLDLISIKLHSEHKAMLRHCKMMRGLQLIRITTSIRTAVDNDCVLDKEDTSYNDIFDAFRPH
jgi:hypothetical protein